MKVEVVQNVYGFSIKKGEIFTAKGTQLDKGTHYYIYDGDVLKGCFPVIWFKEVQKAKKKTVSKKGWLSPEELEAIGQTTIYDYIGGIAQ
jgi:hypothetical protein